MIERHQLPILCGVASRTLICKMILWSIVGMAGLAIKCIRRFVIEVNVLPGDGRMACGAISFVMWFWQFLFMALDACVRYTQVFSRIMAGIADDNGMLAY